MIKERIINEKISKGLPLTINTYKNPSWMSESIMPLIDQWIKYHDGFKDVWRYSDGSFDYCYGSIHGIEKVVDCDFEQPTMLKIELIYNFPVFSECTGETYTTLQKLISGIDEIRHEYTVPEDTELVFSYKDIRIYTEKYQLIESWLEVQVNLDQI